MSILRLAPPCPENSIIYNSSLCECSPGYFLSWEARSCTRFNISPSEWAVNSGVDYSISLPTTTIFSFDQIKKLTQSQAVFLEATVVLLLSWLLFCGLVRLGKWGDGRTVWFRVRWWISRLDVCFATRHWLDDRDVLRKRKTELGGTFSMASCILFIGLLAALLYQILSKRNIEVHNVRAANAPDLVSFVNDLEFNITAISSMTCSHLRGLGTLLVANPGCLGFRPVHLSKFANYSCLNTSTGPMIRLQCSNCPLTWDNVYISWHFVDIPSNPASAVGFQFNLTATNVAHRRHVSTVGGRVNNASDVDNHQPPITFRGANTNILHFNLFPRIYRNFHGLKLVQPLFHEFVPDSFIGDTMDLQSSLESPTDGLVNTTLLINFLSDYVVEIDNQSVLGPVSFLADLGGLYCVSLGIFYYLLVQCEYRIKRLRNEDQVFVNIRRRCKAQDHWDKLRKYVLFTWGRNALQEIYIAGKEGTSCGGFVTKSFRKKGSLHKSRQWEINLHTIKPDIPMVLKEMARPVKLENSKNFIVGDHRVYMSTDDNLPPPTPLPDFKDDEANVISDIQRSLRSLYEYNMVLRDKLVATQSMLEALTCRSMSLNSSLQQGPEEDGTTIEHAIGMGGNCRE